MVVDFRPELCLHALSKQALLTNTSKFAGVSVSSGRVLLKSKNLWMLVSVRSNKHRLVRLTVCKISAASSARVSKLHPTKRVALRSLVAQGS